MKFLGTGYWPREHKTVKSFLMEPEGTLADQNGFYPNAVTVPPPIFPPGPGPAQVRPGPGPGPGPGPAQVRAWEPGPGPGPAQVRVRPRSGPGRAGTWEPGPGPGPGGGDRTD